MWLKYRELTDRQQAQARALFLDAGSPRDDHWYLTNYVNQVTSRNRNPDELEDEEPHTEATEI